MTQVSLQLPRGASRTGVMGVLRGRWGSQLSWPARTPPFVLPALSGILSHPRVLDSSETRQPSKGSPYATESRSFNQKGPWGLFSSASLF